MRIPFTRARRPKPAGPKAPPTDGIRVTDVPAGPHASALPDPATTQLSAEQQGLHDAAKGMYDADGLTLHAPLLHDAKVDAELTQWQEIADQEQVASEQAADHLIAQKRAAAKLADGQLAAAEQQLTEARHQADLQRGVLRGEGDKMWADPARLDEKAWTTLRRSATVPVLAMLLETPLNALALQLLGGGVAETTALAVTIGTVGVLAPHAAGSQVRAVGPSPRRLTTWAVPVALTAFLVAIGLFMSSIRTGFLNQPTTDPTTFAVGPSTLALAHVPARIVFLGWLAVLAAIWLVVAIAAFRNHNPHVAAHRSAQQRAAQLADMIPQLRSDHVAATHAAEAAITDKEQRLARQWAAHRKELIGRADESKANYAHGLAVGMADPEFTAALEAKLHQSNDGRSQIQKQPTQDEPPATDEGSEKAA